LPCSGMHSPIRANRYPLTTITGAQRASGQTHSRARSHQGDADLRADRSTAYLVSCIRVRSAHGNSLDHLVGGRDTIGWKRKPKGVCSTEVDDEIEFRRCIDWKIARIGTAKNAIDVTGSLAEMLRCIGPVGDEPSVIGIFPLRINGGHAS